MRTSLRILLSLLVLTAASAYAADEFVVVSNPTGSVGLLDRAAVSNMFLKKVAHWPSGQAVVPVDQPESSAVRVEFSKAVHNKPAGAIKAYWNQRVFAGVDVQPLELSSDEAVIEQLRKTPGSIGYVSRAANVSGLRVIQIRQ